MCKDCVHNIVFGPGDDDYGRDNIIEDWVCPQCKTITKHTRREIRMGIDNCPNCNWLSEQGKLWEKMIDKLRTKR